MMPVQHAKPSTLADVIAQVKQAFSKMGDATPILIGKAYRSPKKEGQTNIGNAPRVVFAPESVTGSGKIQPPQEMGKAGSMIHTCTVYVRGPETGEDVDRLKATYALGDRVIACVQVAITGRGEWLSMDDGSPLDSDGFGTEIAFAFTYRRDIWHDPKRWALPPADEDTSDESAHPPPGTPIDGVTIVPTTTPPA